MRTLSALWSGRLPLGEAFWKYAVLIGAMVNLAATGGSLAVLAAGLPGALALGVHLLPLPYNAAIAVGVWRSAARYAGPRHHAEAACFVAIVWAALLSLL